MKSVVVLILCAAFVAAHAHVSNTKTSRNAIRQRHRERAAFNKADLEVETDYQVEVEADVAANVDADLATIASTSTDVAVWNSVAGQVIRAENREIWDDITKKLKAAATAPLTEWFHKKKCELCQRIMKNLIDKGCKWGVQKICEWSAGTACSASGVPFASSMCAKICTFGFEAIVTEKCDEWLSLLMSKYPGNPLNFCQSKQFCSAEDNRLPCNCCDTSYCKETKKC